MSALLGRRRGRDRHGAAIAALFGGLAAGLPAPELGASPRSQPPPSVRDAAAALGCAAVAWSTWSGGWWADCTTTEVNRRGEPITVHRYLAFHRQADGQFAMETLLETRATDSPRVKSPWFEKVVQRDGRVVYEARTETGRVRRTVWDLSSNPARLLEDRDGGDKVCQDGFASRTSDVVRRLCVTDHAQNRQRCTVQAPTCQRDPVRIATSSYTAIPVHAADAELQDPDLFRCAAEIGSHREDLVSGTNTGRTAFRVVAVDDTTAGTLSLRLRVRDTTPQPASDTGWLGRDHWELWLASQHADLACDDTADLAAYCQRNQAALDAVEFVVAPRGDGPARFVVAAGAPPASWEREVTAHSQGVELVIELTGALRDWAQSGAITLAYSDSRRGTQADAVLATSPVRPARPETLGQLGDTRLCDRAARPYRP